MKKIILLLVIALPITFFSCKNKQGAGDDIDENYVPPKMDYSVHKLPANIKWQTNNHEPLIASPKAKKGGTFYYYIDTFPLTFRTVGPNSNTSNRGFFLSNHMSLITIHANTEQIIPELATHWAYASDGKTMYFKINKKARWSDGKPVTADDFIYTLEFMRSKYIRTPFYNDFYTKEIDTVKKYDDYTISVSATKKMPDLWEFTNLSPTPKHFYVKLDRDFVEKYNWVAEPNTGPYVLHKFEKQRYLLFKRKQDWWAKDLRYFRNRFNVDYINLIVIRDTNKAFEHLKKGDVDIYDKATFPEEWHAKGNDEIFNKGYVHKLTFYNKTRDTRYGLYLNLKTGLFQDINVRKAFAHAINFEKLNKEIFYGEYARLHTFYSGYGEYANNHIRALPFNIKLVEKYMHQSGWQRGTDGIWIKNNKRFSVKISYSNSIYRPRVVVLKEEAKKAGVELVIRELDPSTGYREVMEKKHEVALMGWSTGFRPEPWQTFHSENANKPQTNNANNLADPVMDKMIDQYRQSISSAERIVLSKRIQQRIHDLCIWVPLWRVPFARTFHWRWIQYPDVPGPRTMDRLFGESMAYGYFWIDEEVKKETLKARKEGKTFKPENKVITKYK